MTDNSNNWNNTQSRYDQLPVLALKEIAKENNSAVNRLRDRRLGVDIDQSFLPTQFAHGGVEAVEGEGEHAVIENLLNEVG